MRWVEKRKALHKAYFIPQPEDIFWVWCTESDVQACSNDRNWHTSSFDLNRSLNLTETVETFVFLLLLWVMEPSRTNHFLVILFLS